MATNDNYLNDNNLRITPIVEFLYPYLVKQDTKFDPKWCLTLRFDPKNNPAHKDFLSKLSAANKSTGEELLKGITKGKNAYRVKDILRAEEDADGNPTGMYLLKVSTKTKPVLKDASGNPVSDHVGSSVSNGTKGRVRLALKKSTATNQKTVGLTAYFDRVQIVELVEYSGGSDNDGFGKVDGGFTVAQPGDVVDTTGGDF